jgi:tRNA uridine 5-carbamoylmethylation protein Kti12
MKQFYLVQQLRLDSLKRAFKSQEDTVKKEKAAEFYEHSLLRRIHAMFELVLNDGAMRFVYSLFTLFLFLLESLVVIYKICSAETHYEKKIKAIEKIGADRLNRLMIRDRYPFPPGKPSDPLNEARLLLKEPSPFEF